MAVRSDQGSLTVTVTVTDLRLAALGWRGVVEEFVDELGGLAVPNAVVHAAQVVLGAQ
ncbi:hypothetical protein [Streptomyces kaempferi]|uniref:Uncharacterized protein n=1 Tax=Streptomyces kaempferi TaxID=333725 RepID=A0ABW3XVT8_9ACTN